MSLNCTTKKIKADSKSKFMDSPNIQYIDSGLIVCHFFNLYKPLGIEADSLITLSFVHINLEALDVIESPQGVIEGNELQNVLEFMFFHQGPLPYFCSDIEIVNAEVPDIVKPTSGKIIYKFIESDSFNELELLLINIEAEDTRSLPSGFILSDTIVYKTNF